MCTVALQHLHHHGVDCGATGKHSHGGRGSGAITAVGRQCRQRVYPAAAVGGGGAT